MSAQSNSLLPTHIRGLIVLGVQSSQRVKHALSKYPASAGGYEFPVILVDRDIEQARRCINELDISPPDRFEGCFGPDAFQELEALLKDRAAWGDLPELIEVCSDEYVPEGHALAQQLEALHQFQNDTCDALRTELESRYRSSESENQSQEAGTTSQSPLRIMLVTTRHSTYIQYSMQDLRDAFFHLGHEVNLVIEPSAHIQMSPLRVLRAQHDFNPDVIVVINIPRALQSGSFPACASHVCWIQDAMGHLFEPFVGEVSDLDFMAGFMYPTSPVLMSIPPERRLEFPVPVSSLKFHSSRVSDTLQRTYECDIAYISHQSQTPEQFVRDALARWPKTDHRVLLQVRDHIQESATKWSSEIQIVYEGTFSDTFSPMLQADDDEFKISQLWHQFAQPLLERILRHNMLQWASSIADDHSLDMRLYGKGWDQHPTLARYARGPLEHGEELRASYQCARVQLHASMHGVGHQRLHECALSGGLMISLRSWSSVCLEHWGSITEYLKENMPDASDIASRQGCYVLDRHPGLQQLLHERDSLPPLNQPWDDDINDGLYSRDAQPFENPTWHERGGRDRHRPLRLLADPQLMTFSTRNEMERTILRACRDSAWRNQLSVATAALSKEHVSMSKFAQCLIDMVRREHSIKPRKAMSEIPS